MASNNERFKVIYSQKTSSSSTEILVDTKSKILYLFHKDGDAGGITPLLGHAGYSQSISLDSNGEPLRILGEWQIFENDPIYPDHITLD